MKITTCVAGIKDRFPKGILMSVTPDESIRFQTKALLEGVTWLDGEGEVRHTDKPVIAVSIIENKMFLNYGQNIRTASVLPGYFVVGEESALRRRLLGVKSGFGMWSEQVRDARGN